MIPAHAFLIYCHVVGAGWDKIYAFFFLLPGRIVTGIGNLGSLLIQAGRNLITGLLNGVESMFVLLASALARII